MPLKDRTEIGRRGDVRTERKRGMRLFKVLGSPLSVNMERGKHNKKPKGLNLCLGVRDVFEKVVANVIEVVCEIIRIQNLHGFQIANHHCKFFNKTKFHIFLYHLSSC